MTFSHILQRYCCKIATFFIILQLFSCKCIYFSIFVVVLILCCRKHQWSHRNLPYFTFFWLCVYSNNHTLFHNRGHTHIGVQDDYHPPYYCCTDNRSAPMGLPIHCNPSNTLNFHFKQKLNRKKTQGSVLFLFVLSFLSFPGFISRHSNHLFSFFSSFVFRKFSDAHILITTSSYLSKFICSYRLN